MVLCSGCAGKEAPVAENQAETAVETTESAAPEAEDEAAEVTEEMEQPEVTDSTADSGEQAEAEADQETESDNMSARDLFADFVMGKGAAGVADDCYLATVMTTLTFDGGAAFTVQDIKELLEKDNELLAGKNPEISYAPLSFKDKKLYALQLYYEADVENVTELLILSEDAGELKIIFAGDSWSRRYISVNENGIIHDDGSNGAGSHVYEIYAPDASLTYHKVSSVDEEYYGFEFWDENGPNEALNETMKEAGEGNADATEIVYYKEDIDGKSYYYYLGDSITQEMVDYIDGIAAKHNFKFDGKATADEAREAYEKQLGVEDIVSNEKEPQWKKLG
jgi:hypothetical protein